MNVSGGTGERGEHAEKYPIRAWYVLSGGGGVEAGTTVLSGEGGGLSLSWSWSWSMFYT